MKSVTTPPHLQIVSNTIKTNAFYMFQVELVGYISKVGKILIPIIVFLSNNVVSLLIFAYWLFPKGIVFRIRNTNINLLATFLKHYLGLITFEVEFSYKSFLSNSSRKHPLSNSEYVFLPNIRVLMKVSTSVMQSSEMSR